MARSVRSSGGFGGRFGLGWNSQSWAVRLAIITGVVSCLMVVARNSASAFLAMEHAFSLSPTRVFHGEVYEVLTYALLENPFHPDGRVDIINLVMSVYVLWVFGLQIEQRVGSRTFVGYFFGFAAAGALFALGCSLVFPSVSWRSGRRLGRGTAFTVVYARLNPDNPILIGFLIPVAGRYLVYLTLGILVLESIAMGPAYSCHFGAFAAAEISMRGLRPGRPTCSSARGRSSATCASGPARLPSSRATRTRTRATTPATCTSADCSRGFARLLDPHQADVEEYRLSRPSSSYMSSRRRERPGPCSNRDHGYPPPRSMAGSFHSVDIPRTLARSSGEESEVGRPAARALHRSEARRHRNPEVHQCDS